MLKNIYILSYYFYKGEIIIYILMYVNIFMIIINVQKNKIKLMFYIYISVKRRIRFQITKI